ncbi:hypothetical protein Pla52o_16890 [Novipirellula galeiformis]|uniref:Uncharacterized protein n=1 Tax=Novipirellula galeiformis TaxID=2528004 RepID=A0A5C6CLQ6_9BACT|nr:hypothetical protein [Novipirellula galeiformis]TWU25388.1 hypothetical protein Pla52o_16890 [Novipirellula galeiformis]
MLVSTVRLEREQVATRRMNARAMNSIPIRWLVRIEILLLSFVVVAIGWTIASPHPITTTAIRIACALMPITAVTVAVTIGFRSIPPEAGILRRVLGIIIFAGIVIGVSGAMIFMLFGA